MTDYLLLFVAVLSFGVISWRHLRLATNLIVLLLPSYLLRFNFGWLPVTFLELLILTLAGVFLLKKISGRLENRIKPSSYKFWILVIFLSAVGATIMSPSLLPSLGVLKAYIIEPLLFFLIYFNVTRDRRDCEASLNFLGISALILAGFAIFQGITGQFIPNEFWSAAATRRVTSVFGYPNAVALYLAPIAVLFVGRAWLLFESRVLEHHAEPLFICKTLFYCLVFVMSGVAVFLAKSEGGLVAIVLAVFIFALLIRRTRAIAFIGATLTIAFLLLVPAWRGLIVEKATLSDFSGNIRVVVWQETWQMLRAQPIFGAGLAGFQSVISEYHHPRHLFEVYLYPHNIFLNFWSELGLAGLIAFCGIVLKYFFDYRHCRASGDRSFYLVILAAMSTIIIHGIVDVPYFKNDLSVLFWLFLGISAVLTRKNSLNLND